MLSNVIPNVNKRCQNVPNVCWLHVWIKLSLLASCIVEDCQIEEVSLTTHGGATANRRQALGMLLVPLSENILLEKEFQEKPGNPSDVGIILVLDRDLEKELMEQTSTLSLVELVV